MKIKKPLSKGVAKTPVVIQLEALECGAASLTMILAYYNKWIPLEQVRVDCGVSRDGSSAINVIKAARHYGLEANGYKVEPEDFLGNVTFPCIVHWNFNHFIVVKGIRGKNVYINDPARGEVTMPLEKFDEGFTGVVLLFEPTSEFKPSGSPKSVLSFVKKRINGLKAPIIFSMLTTIITSLIGIITPVFDRVFYDRLLTKQNPDWFIPFIIALGAIYLIEVLLNLISTTSNLKINGKISLVGNTSYMWKVLHLPIHFFTQRMTGDIVSRQSSNQTIANTLVNVLSPLFFNMLMMVFYLVVMIRYSPVLTIVGICSVIINMAVSNFISKKRINLSRVSTRDNGRLYSSTVASVQLIESIKSSGAEDGFYENWDGCLATVNHGERKFEKQNATLELIPSIVSSIASSIILGIGIYLTIKGNFTLGMITAFQGFFNSFIAPATQLINSGQTIQEMKTEMERIEDVMEYQDDPYAKDLITDKKDFYKLTGEITINHLSFGYSPLAEPLIKDFNLKVKPGSCVALVGASGCGKSTLSKLISGLYPPREGEILFDGKRIDEIDHSIFTGSVAVVDQDIVLFEDTIANNIKMWDDSIEDFEMILAARDAQIHQEILERKDGYSYKLSEGGKDFSGGQRQRLEIARVLAQDPTIIILDEATSALDAKTEYAVVKAIKERGITCIIIAHRLSTIRDCDEILVLDKGVVMERGTHKELIAKDGYYKDLISSD